MAKVRLGFADIAIARPLTWAILKGEHSEVFATSLLPHARVVPLLDEGALDLGLVSATEVDQHRLVTVPDLGVVLVAGGGAATLECDSAALPRDSAVDDEACPGVRALADRLIDHRYGAGSSGASGVGARDVRLVAGFHSDGLAAQTPTQTQDLAASWQADFAEEPVAYVWAHRPNADLGSAEFALKSCLRFGLGSLLALSRELAAERGLEAETVERFFTSSVRFVRRV